MLFSSQGIQGSPYPLENSEEQAMKATMVIGLVLIILGVLALGYQGVLWVNTRETVARVGPVEVQANRQHAIPLAPILSGVAIVAGIALLIGGANRRAT
jgi:hypothetical protein